MDFFSDEKSFSDPRHFKWQLRWVHRGGNKLNRVPRRGHTVCFSAWCIKNVHDTYRAQKHSFNGGTGDTYRAQKALVSRRYREHIPCSKALVSRRYREHIPCSKSTRFTEVQGTHTVLKSTRLTEVLGTHTVLKALVSRRYRGQTGSHF